MQSTRDACTDTGHCPRSLLFQTVPDFYLQRSQPSPTLRPVSACRTWGSKQSSKGFTWRCKKKKTTKHHGGACPRLGARRCSCQRRRRGLPLPGIPPRPPGRAAGSPRPLPGPPSTQRRPRHPPPSRPGPGPAALASASASPVPSPLPPRGAAGPCRPRPLPPARSSVPASWGCFFPPQSPPRGFRDGGERAPGR